MRRSRVRGNVTVPESSRSVEEEESRGDSKKKKKRRVTRVCAADGGRREEERSRTRPGTGRERTEEEKVAAERPLARAAATYGSVSVEERRSVSVDPEPRIMLRAVPTHRHHHPGA